MVNITNAVFFYGFSVYSRRNRIHTFMIFFFCFTLPLFLMMLWVQSLVISFFFFLQRVLIKLTRVGAQSECTSVFWEERGWLEGSHCTNLGGKGKFCLGCEPLGRKTDGSSNEISWTFCKEFWRNF